LEGCSYASLDDVRRDDATEHQHELMEVWGFDLLAHVEAILRHVRQYQREVQRLRGLMGKGQTETSDRPPVDAVLEHVKQLQRASLGFNETLDEIVRSADGKTPQAPHRAGPPSRKRRRLGRPLASS
jgi:phage host-nuclease inhibitor protein Gam